MNQSFKDGLQWACDATEAEIAKVKLLLNKGVKSGDCLLGHTIPNAKGYCYTSIGRTRKVRAHRLIYEVINGKLDYATVVRHTCDIRNCINPNHLVAGTVADNQRDMKDRKRAFSRGAMPTNVMTLGDTLRLRQSGLTLSEIAVIQGLAGPSSVADRLRRAAEVFLND